MHAGVLESCWAQAQVTDSPITTVSCGVCQAGGRPHLLHSYSSLSFTATHSPVALSEINKHDGDGPVSH